MHLESTSRACRSITLPSEQATVRTGTANSVPPAPHFSRLVHFLGFFTIAFLTAVAILAEDLSLDSAIAAASDKTEPSNERHILRHNALRTIDDLGSAAARAIPVLRGILSDKQECEYCRWLAAKTLGSIGEPALSEVPALCRVLADRSDHQNVRTNVAKTLGQLGPMAKNAIGVLVGVLKDTSESRELRTVVAQSIGHFGPLAAKSSVGTLARLATGADRDLQLESIRALGEMGYQARAAIPILANLSLGNTTDPELFEIAVYSLGAIAADAQGHVTQLGTRELSSILSKLREVRNQLSELRRPTTVTVIRQIDGLILAAEKERQQRFPNSFFNWLFTLVQPFKALFVGTWPGVLCACLLLISIVCFAVHFFAWLFFPEVSKARRAYIEHWKLAIKPYPLTKPFKAPIGICLSWLLAIPFAAWAANIVRKLVFRSELKSVTSKNKYIP